MSNEHVIVGKRKLERVDLKAMNMPEDCWLARVDKIQPKARPQLTTFLNKLPGALQRGVGLLLHGGPGVGKTAAACVVGKEARSIGFTVYFTSFWQLREDIRSEAVYNDTESIADRCRNVDLLILDNLREEDGAEKYYLSVRTIEELLAFRRSRQRSTIVTTRMAVKELENKLVGLHDAIDGNLLSMAISGVNLREQQNEKLAEEFLTPSK